MTLEAVAGQAVAAAAAIVLWRFLLMPLVRRLVLGRRP